MIRVKIVTLFSKINKYDFVRAGRDAARKISFIKEKYKEEVRQHLLEMKEYDRLLFHDLREIRFYSTKNKTSDFT